MFVVTGVSLSNLMDTSKNGYPIVTSITTGSYGLRSESLLYHQDVLIHFEMRVKVIESLFEKGGSYMVRMTGVWYTCRSFTWNSRYKSHMHVIT